MGIGIVAIVNECTENKEFDTFDVKVTAIGNIGYHLKRIYVRKDKIKTNIKKGATILIEKSNHKFYNPRLLLTLTPDRVEIVKY